jgi:putative ABC transport system permease protein
MTIVARVPGDAGQAAGALTAAVHSVDPNQPVADVRGLDSLVSADLARPRFTALLLGGFAGAALLLAALGLYGVIAFGVAHRRREIGVRVALGAEPRDVVGLMMKRGLGLIVSGLAVGLGGALALGRNVAALLYGVSASDSETLITVTLILGMVGLLATYLPARRAAWVDPVVVLKAE